MADRHNGFLDNGDAGGLFDPFEPVTAAAKMGRLRKLIKIVRVLAKYGCLTQMHVVRLLAPRLDNENHTKDIDFSPNGIRRW